MRSALILEDHDEPREWLVETVQQAFAGVEAVAVPTLDQARLWTRQRPFDIALVDLNLPDGSGVELVRELESTRPETYVVVATIFDDDDHLFAALQAGAQGYLIKDQPRERVVAQLRGITRGEPPLSPRVARRILRYFQRHAAPDESGLTERETEVLRLLARGFSRSDIAVALEITPNTTAGYIKAIYRKLNVSGRAEAALEAVRLGLVDPTR